MSLHTSLTRAAAFLAIVLPVGAEVATADGVFTFTDASAFNAALSGLGTVSSIVADYEGLPPQHHAV